MTIWIDAQLSPSLALWINQTFDDIQAQSMQAIGLRNASDQEIFERARKQNVVIMSKDDDFARLVRVSGAPPKIIWITCGNTSNARMRDILSRHLHKIVRLLNSGNDLVELSEM